VKTIYFHIGWPKTGTTSIQKFLRDGRRRLAQSGWFYAPNLLEAAAGQDRPVSDVMHSAILKELLPKRRKVAALKPGFSPLRATLEAFEASNCHTMVLSNENLFWSAPRIGQERLPESWRDHRVHLIAYARRFDEYYPSLYKQRVGAGATFVRSYADFVESRLSNRPISVYLEQLQALYGGRVRLRSFDRARRRGLLRDFCDVIRLPDALRAPDMEAYRANVSLSDAAALLLLELRRRGAAEALTAAVRKTLSRSDGKARDAGGPLSQIRIGEPGLQETLRTAFNAEADDLRARGLADLPPAEPSGAAGLVWATTLDAAQCAALTEALPASLRAQVECALAQPLVDEEAESARRERRRARKAAAARVDV
jgi:hypothetical protein